MFKEMRHNGGIAGFTLARDGKFYFFGTGHTRREDLAALFPRYEFCFLKQVHGRRIVRADPAVAPEADGHFTEQKRLALVVQSADCTPVLISSGEKICAVHAGWRGMAENILGEAKRELPGARFAAIGPHILRESFEVGRDVADRLLAAAPAPGSSMISPHPDPSKAYFDLKLLAEAQLRGPGLEIAECLRDTMTDPLFYSYRRGRQARERQYSFVVIDPDLR